MTAPDYLVVVLAVALLLAAGFLGSRRAGKNTGEFILGGRRIPWWLGGSAMAAGGTNADAVLHQSGKIMREGLTGAWFYWSQIFAYVWHALIFSRLWRRSRVNTVVEFYDIRYAGTAAKLGRLWSMVFATFVESIVGLALGLLAMIKICEVLLGLGATIHVCGVALPTGLAITLSGLALGMTYSTVAGLHGVVAGDLVEMIVALLCSYLLTFIVYRRVGFAPGLEKGLAAAGKEGMLSFRAAGGASFVVFFLIQPFVSASGNSALNQRFLSFRDERQAELGGLWRLISHYFLRCWPWYICGLVAVVLLPGVPSESVYPVMIARFLPAGMRGLIFAGLLVTFMGSVGTQIHNSGSVFVNDFYRPYVVRNGSERHYVFAIRATMVGVGAFAVWIALASDQILRLLEIGMTITAASGVVMSLRWFWWRINGWADFAAQLFALPVTLFYEFGPGRRLVEALQRLPGEHSSDDGYGFTFTLTVATTTLLAFAAMAVTRPEPAEKIDAFYRRLRPYGWWRPVAERCPNCPPADRFGADFGRYCLGLGLALGLLFGMGLLLLGRPLQASIYCAGGLLAGAWLIRIIGSRPASLGEEEPADPPVTPLRTTR